MFPGSVNCGMAAQLATHTDRAEPGPPSRLAVRAAGRAARTEGAPPAATMRAHAASLPGFQRRASAPHRSLNDLGMTSSPGDAKALGRPEVALPQSAGVDDEILQHDGGID